MKVKFTKLAALLLAGVALFATGCIDYEVDIQKVDKKVDELASGRVASLENQLAALQATLTSDYETIANHNKDVEAINKTITDLETALRALIDTKADKAAFEDFKTKAEAAINSLKALTADFPEGSTIKQYIDGLNTAMDARVQKLEGLLAGDWGDKTVQQTINDLATQFTTAMGILDQRVQNLETAVDELTKKDGIIDQIKAQIATLQALTAGEWKDAEGNPQTIKEYVDAVKETLRLLSENYAALVDGLEGKSIKEFVEGKLEDYVLTTTFQELVDVIGTEKEFEDLKGTIISHINALETLTAGFPEDKTIKEYVDAETAKLQGQLDKITNAEGTGRLDILEEEHKALSEKVDKIYDQIKFALDYKGGLQGYIDDAAAKALADAMAYTDSQIEDLKKYVDDCLTEIWYEIWGIESDIEDLYERVNLALSRIQSIQFVPDYDDLKITSNMSIVTSTVEALDEDGEPTGEMEVVATAIDQPTQVTYQFLPAQYAQDIADGVEQLITNVAYTKMALAYYYGIEFDDEEAPFTREELKELGLTGGLLPFFNVKPVNTRADEADAVKPEFMITGIANVDTTSGEITFDIMPVNVASAEFAANGLKPQYNVQLRDNGSPYIPGSGHHIWGTDHHDRGYVGYGEDYTWSIPIWKYEDLKKFEKREAFAAQLRFYNLQYVDVDWDNLDWDALFDDPDYEVPWIDYENELASPYNVLYPGVTNVEILGEPYKPTYDDEGKPVEDADGYAVLEPAMEEHQELPYSSLRKGTETIPPFVGERENQDPKGYRVILKESIPAVKVDGGEPMTFEDAADKYGLILPDYEITFDKFTYEFANASGDKEKNFVETNQVYAEIEMNPAQTPAQRKFAIGDVITGTYSYTTFLGTFKGWGDVTITKALGDVKVDATITWTWAEDALVDHNLFYFPGTTEPQVYSRTAYELTVNADDLDYIEDNLDITIADFDHQKPVSVVVTYKDAEGKDVEVKYDPETGKPVDTDAVGPTINAVSIVDGKLVADITDFKWDMVYNIEAVYDLPDAQITVHGTITTVDRNREPVTVDIYEYTFDINKLDEETGFGWTGTYYKWRGEDMTDRIFKAFDEDGVINLLKTASYDFEYDKDATEFYNNELKGKIKHGNGEGSDGVPPDVYEYLKVSASKLEPYTETTFTAAKLKEVNSGKQDPNDPYTFLGDTLWRYFTTYIGEVVQVPFQFNYRVPAYDFLHQDNYTFDDGKWYTMASPKYDYNKSSLKKYDVHYMNVPALAFNIIDQDKRFFNYLDEVDPKDENYFYNKDLVINFWYTGDEYVDETELEEQSATDELTTYGDLWFDASLGKQEPYNVKEGDNFKHTVFYYRSTADAIPMYGTLEIMCDGVAFEIPTSFEKDNGGKYIAKQDYSNFELRPWKPFYVPTYEQTMFIDLDEHTFYTANVLEGLQFYDGRQVAASATVTGDTFAGEGTYSIADFNNGVKSYFRPMLGFNDVNAANSSPAELVWGWIVGNCDQDGKSLVEDAAANGYYDGVSSWTAYDLQAKSFVFSTDGVPKELRRLVDVNEQNYVMSFDYTSQLEFMNTAEVDFAFELQSPWQKFEKPFSVKVIIRGLNVQ